MKRVKPSDREDSWTHLMDQSLRGDARAYERLLRLLTVALRNAVRGRARAAGLDADDVVQEVLLALHLKRSTWTQGAPVGAWVAAIARNKIVDALRRRGRRVAVPIDEVLETLGVETRAREEHVHDLDTALGRLNPRQRDVVRAISLEGHTAREAAVQLRMTEGAVRVTLHRSLKAMAATLREAIRIPTGLDQFDSTNLTRSGMPRPTASACTPSSSARCPARLSQKVRYPNHLAPAASHTAAAQNTISGG